MKAGRAQGYGLRSRYAAVLVAILLLGLPLAAWLDLRVLSERILRDQADDVSRIIDVIRDFYATNVVDRVMQAHGTVIAAQNFREIPGAIPIPATFRSSWASLSARKTAPWATASSPTFPSRDGLRIISTHSREGRSMNCGRARNLRSF